ncbi:lipase chaperone [Myxococcus sp. RHSTA-1-4]|uniref:lipase chaperone n=1 Tax=Myxococcus sp. RHSTA-1-4 TaxID=2874601 RepID=UPI001CBE5D88|nr:lipase chaperone [Myxococcus sp. RHSTA-1-4]MBZ4422771.1 lipase chaperone [Myxococcus sp. RHSTA-1-4]
MASSLPEAREIQAQLLLARVRHSLERAWRRASAQGDFSLAPGRILQSLLDRRCGLMEQHAEELQTWKHSLGLEGSSGAELCRGLLFASLREGLALPEDLTPARLWSLLEQVDAAYEQLVVREASSSSESGFRAAVERFREARRHILGPELDARLFGLSDDVLLLPSQVDALLRAPGASVEQNVATWRAGLQRIEREHGVRLADVMEPLELARQELRLREASGPLDEEARRAVLERHAGPEVASRELAFRHEQQELAERLSAFNAEREQLLEKLRGEGLTEAQLRERLPEIDQRLFEKYHLR